MYNLNIELVSQMILVLFEQVQKTKQTAYSCMFGFFNFLDKQKKNLTTLYLSDFLLLHFNSFTPLHYHVH